MSASVFNKRKICVCFQCCMCNFVSFKIFSSDEVLLVLVYLHCSLEHKHYHKLHNFTSSIYIYITWKLMEEGKQQEGHQQGRKPSCLLYWVTEASLLHWYCSVVASED